jgi:hypothetical protein
VIAAFSLSELCHRSGYVSYAIKAFSRSLCLVRLQVNRPVALSSFTSIPPFIVTIVTLIPAFSHRPDAVDSFAHPSISPHLCSFISFYASFAPDAFPRSSSDHLQIRYRVPSSPHIRSFRCCHFSSYHPVSFISSLDVPSRLSCLLCPCVVPDVW